MNRSVIIVAGGLGVRMGGNLPKQFQPLLGKPILVHTIEKFIEVLNPQSKIVVVLPSEHMAIWDKLLVLFPHLERVQIAAGGKSRYASVKNGLKLISLFGVVAIHDAVRPLVSKGLIVNAYKEAEEFGSAIPSVEISDSLRIFKNGKLQVVERDLVKGIQTPQVFNNQFIQQAYASVNDSKFITDDATVFERTGRSLHFISGEQSNIKLTNPFDLLIAEAFLGKKF